MSNLRRGVFWPDELVKLNPADYVVLNSGGPLLRLECIEGENAVVSWMDGDAEQRRMVPTACLSRLAPLAEAAI